MRWKDLRESKKESIINEKEATVKKNEEVVIMTASLAMLLRQSISNEEELVTIGQEVEYVRSYLTIQKMRYKDKLEFKIDVDPYITHVPIIRLVLQPIV